MNTHAAKLYIPFLINSKNQHGVHSPFVYDLVTKCFYDKTNYTEYQIIKAYRIELTSNKSIVEIEDFGSGSKRFKTNKRQVKNIAKTSGSTLTKSFLLFRLVKYFNAKTILELGTSVGIGIAALALGNKNAELTSIEASSILTDISRNQLKIFDIDNVNIKNGLFSEILPSLKTYKWDFVFIDGHHDQTATLNYFEMLLPSTHNDTVIIFDDIYWSEGMLAAWKTIIKHPKVSVSIDIFHFGLVFFRKEQTKEHFYIRL